MSNKESWKKRLKSDKSSLNEEHSEIKFVPDDERLVEIESDLDILGGQTMGLGGAKPDIKKILKGKHPFNALNNQISIGREKDVPTKSSWGFDDRSVMQKHVDEIKDKIKKGLPLSPVDKEWKVRFVLHNVEQQKNKAESKTSTGEKGHNLKLGQADGDKGRKMGAKAKKE